jgi:type IV secretion system protein VirB2
LFKPKPRDTRALSEQNPTNPAGSSLAKPQGLRPSRLKQATAWGIGAAAVAASALLAADPALAQALAPVVRGATIIRDTVVAIALLIMTAAVGIAGFRIAFSGASFRDVSNLVVGGALAGGAAAIAAIFIV